MKFNYELVTPAKAEKYLQLNTANFRKLDHLIVKKYARDMNAGDWHENGDPIQIGPDKDGMDILKNGQHRLHAIIASGCAQMMLIVRDVPADGRFMDRGKSRTGASYLAFAGLAEAEACWTIAKMCIAYQSGWWGLPNIPLHHITDAQIHSFIESHTEELQSATRLVKPLKSICAISISGPIAFYGAKNNHPEKSDLVCWFMEKFRTGEGLSREQPLLHLRTMILQRSEATKLRTCIKRAYVTMAWNRTVMNIPTTKLYLRLTGPNPQEMPSVIMCENEA